jgi:hypothetical protein
MDFQSIVYLVIEFPDGNLHGVRCITKFIHHRDAKGTVVKVSPVIHHYF